MDASFDIIVLGAGHAGCEAAHAPARMGLRTLLVTMDPERAALMSCNPAVGGLGKGQLAREVDALGGLMGRAIDATGIQFRLLNRSKGPAVQAPRAQADKAAYAAWMARTLRETDNLSIAAGIGVGILADDNGVAGVALEDGRRFGARAVICSAGTFLDGLIHIGLNHFPAGRAGERAAVGLAGSFRALGLETGRLKTGTPARLHRDSIDYSRLERQDGDEPPPPFSFETERIDRPQAPCYITYTNARTHEIIRGGLDRSPLYTGVIQSVGPRYCPSIEDKVVRFPDRDRHQVFLEPEGIDSPEVYPNGIPTSLPEDIQRAFIRTIPGLELARILRLAYGIEYTFCPPRQLRPTLETRAVPGLYLTGQLNATTGYEEAAAQGLMAGINAALKIRGEAPLTLGRDEAYIGVLIDDLITRDHVEPYRMFTSRAEYRLALRHDTADRRLTGHGRRVGLIGDERWARFQRRMDSIQGAIATLSAARPKRDSLAAALERRELPPSDKAATAGELLSRPELGWEALKEMGLAPEGLSEDEALQVYLHFRYDGYLRKEATQVERFRRLEDKRIPDSFDVRTVRSLRNESMDKLARFRPATLGQAARITGVTPADIAVLMVALKAHGARGGDASRAD